jgi:gas vesicle protein
MDPVERLPGARMGLPGIRSSSTMALPPRESLERAFIMGRFLLGVLVGLGVSLLIAPKPGTELRRLVAQSWSDLQNLLRTSEPHKLSAPEPGEPLPSAQEVAQRAAQAGTTVPASAQQPTHKTGVGPDALSQTRQQASRDLPPTRQGRAGTTKRPR